MKTKSHFLIFLGLILYNFTFSTNIYKHQIFQSEVDELNKLGDAIGITGKGWPVSDEEFDKNLDVFGVSFINTARVFKEFDGADSVIIKKYKVSSISFYNAGSGGTLPSLSFGELISFQFDSSQLSGEIPNFDFPSCLSLSLSGNAFSGEIPNFYLPQLTQLVLNNNKLTGKIPALNLPQLKYLYLNNNELTGDLTDLNLPQLEVLKLSNNSLSGELILFTGLPSLKNLSIENNELTSINKNFGFPNLEYLTVSGNKFSGELPSINCPKLIVLDLNNYQSYSNSLGYMFSGSIPNDINLPSCEVLKLNHNNLTGIIPELNMPKLKHLDIHYNKLSGGLSNIPDLISLVTLDVSYNDFSGKLPAFNLPDLTSLNCARCKFIGPIPNIYSPLLVTLNLGGNELTDSIPDFNFPKLVTLDLSSNKLTGAIPNFNLPKLVTLDLVANKLSGSIPNLNLPALRYFEANANNLSGEIPNLSLPSLTTLRLSNNMLSGNLPLFYLPSIDEIRLDNNKLSGEIPEFNFPKIDEIYLFDNDLSGIIPTLDLPLLRYLNLHNNNLEGKVDNSKLPNLFSLTLQGNKITDLPELIKSSPKLNGVNVRNCKLTFEDIEPNVGLKYFYYEDQDSVEHNELTVGNKITLKIKVGGTANLFQWMKSVNGQAYIDIPGATSDSVIVGLEINTKYTCKISNSLAPKLTLYSKPGTGPECISLGNLDLCVKGGNWESKEENELAATGLISINDLLIFEGSMTIDTAQLSVKAEGEFYINEIPIPGGSTGKYSFCKGEYNLKLLGEEGTITNFLDSKFDALGQLFGIDLKLSSLQLIGGRNASAIKMNCKIGVPGIAGSCGETGNEKTEFELNGLQIGKTGISLDGISITDLGLFFNGYCLKNLLVNYDSQKDILTSGMLLALPFGEIGGGFKLAQGYLDSIAWRLEAAKPPFVIGTTTIGIAGFFGHISSITEPKIEIELGGIFKDILSDNFYYIEASGRTVWPSIFEVKGEGKFLKPPLINKPYQVNGGVLMNYDHPMQMFKIEFKGKIGTSDEKTWLLDGNGDLKLSTKFDTPVLSGEVKGKMELQKFANKFPYNWLNSMFSFPIEANSQSTFVWGKNHVLHGTATFQTETRGPYGLRYVVNLEKSYGDDDFLWFETKIEKKSAKLKNGNITNETAEIIQIPENAEFAVVGIISKSKSPVSTLKNPSGKIYTGPSEADNIVYSSSPDGKESFWTVTTPVPGNWEVVLTNPAASDSIILFVQQKPADLKISMTQSGKTVNVNWNAGLFTNNESIVVLLDDNNSGFDGFAVAEGNANTGSISFEVSDSFSACSYHIFAQISDDISTHQAYAEGVINNQKFILAAPEITNIQFENSTGKTKVLFKNSTDISTSGYIVEVVDDLGYDSLYSIVNFGNQVIELNIPDHENKSIKMTSFNANGLSGCPSPLVGIMTAAEDFALNETNRNSLIFYPNPTSGKGTIEFNIDEDTFCNLSIVDFYGRIINQPLNEQKPRGIYQEELDFGNLPNGMYLIVLKTKKGVNTAKCILNR